MEHYAKKLLARLEHLIAEGGKILPPPPFPRGTPIPEIDIPIARALARLQTRWVESSRSILKFAGMKDHLARFDNIERRHYSIGEGFSEFLGVLESAHDDIEAGFIFELKHLLHADFFGSLQEQAADLLRAGHKIPAAVLGRIVIERWLFDEADRSGIKLPENAKASKVNEELKRASIFSTPRCQQIQGFLAVGNSAAHGKFDDFTDNDVSLMLEFIKVNCT
jgi:hypothetical protein